MSRLTLCAIALLAFAAFPVAAAECGSSQPEPNDCAQAEAEAAMQTAYVALEEAIQARLDGPFAALNALRDSQQAWDNQVLQDCAILWAIHRDSHTAPMAVAGCRREMAEARTVWLNRLRETVDLF